MRYDMSLMNINFKHKTITLPPELCDFINDNAINLSRFVRNKLIDKIKEEHKEDKYNVKKYENI
jgi:hypothetical protein